MLQLINCICGNSRGQSLPLTVSVAWHDGVMVWWHSVFLAAFKNIMGWKSRCSLDAYFSSNFIYTAKQLSTRRFRCHCCRDHCTLARRQIFFFLPWSSSSRLQIFFKALLHFDIQRMGFLLEFIFRKSISIFRPDAHYYSNSSLQMLCIEPLITHSFRCPLSTATFGRRSRN